MGWEKGCCYWKSSGANDLLLDEMLPQPVLQLRAIIHELSELVLGIIQIGQARICLRGLAPADKIGNALEEVHRRNSFCCLL